MQTRCKNDENESYYSNVSLKPLSRSYKYTCHIHSIFFRQHLCSSRRIKKRCIECLKKNVYANVGKNQVVLEEKNYIFPMLCDICAINLKKCKWCRPFDHVFMIKY